MLSPIATNGVLTKLLEVILNDNIFLLNNLTYCNLSMKVCVS